GAMADGRMGGLDGRRCRLAIVSSARERASRLLGHIRPPLLSQAARGRTAGRSAVGTISARDAFSSDGDPSLDECRRDSSPEFLRRFRRGSDYSGGRRYGAAALEKCGGGPGGGIPLRDVRGRAEPI